MTRLSGTDAFLSRMGQYIARYDLIAPGGRVLVAVSGGVDSMVALHALHQLGYAVEAAHFDHQTRNGASAADAAFVQETCAHMGIPCHVTSEAVEADAHQVGRSFEDYARERRYAFLCRTARERGGIPVATAHHEDDQAETMLMGLLGMTSGFGLTGIAPVREEQGIRIIRPLLSCSRDSIEAYAESRHLSWREDATNGLACCTRNKVRLELLPFLRTYSPHAGTALARLADIMRTNGAYLDEIAGKILGNCTPPPLVLDRRAFQNAHEALQRRMLKMLAQRLGVNLSHERIVSAIGFAQDAKSGAQFELGGGALLHVTGDEMFFQPAEQMAQDVPGSGIALNVPGTTRLAGCVIETRLIADPVLPQGGIRAWCTATKQYFDADKLTGSLLVRTRKSGDRMIPLGMEHARKIQDLMVDLHIPAFQRDDVPLVLMNSEILWVAGHTRSCHAPVDKTTTTLLEMELLLLL